jgi:hypothetical protein
VLEGLGRQSVRFALSFLAEIDWTPEVEAALTTLPQTWIERNGRHEVEGAFLATEHRFSEYQRCLLRKQLALPSMNRLRLFEDLEKTYEPLTTISHEVPA